MVGRVGCAVVMVGMRMRGREGRVAHVARMYNVVTISMAFQPTNDFNKIRQPNVFET